MKLTLYQVDAFTDKLFGGNPAAIVPLKDWLPDNLMQQLAMENNLSETAFFVPSKNKKADYDIRWFTPALEINLCGHATLGSSFVVMELLEKKKNKVVFSSQSGLLSVKRERSSKKFMGLMDFPSWKPSPVNDPPANLKDMLGVDEIVAVYKSRDYLIELPSEDAVSAAKPDFTAIKNAGEKIIIAAPGKNVDFVSRFFAPSAGVDEDPVTGSAHSQLIPYWSEKLHKATMNALQLSRRGGVIYCEQLNEKRVIIGGTCAYYMQGQIRISKPQEEK